MKGGGGSAPAAAAQVMRNGQIPDTFLEGKNWIGGQIGCGGVKEREESGCFLAWALGRTELPLAEMSVRGLDHPSQGDSENRHLGILGSGGRPPSTFWGSLLKPMSFRVCFLKDGTQKD